MSLIDFPKWSFSVKDSAEQEFQLQVSFKKAECLSDRHWLDDASLETGETTDCAHSPLSLDTDNSFSSLLVHLFI